jgi:hypothetical protein
MSVVLANGEDAPRSQLMGDDTDTQIDSQIANQRAKLEGMSLREVGQEFQFIFGIPPDLPAGKGSLIERILAKSRAQLERSAEW